MTCTFWTGLSFKGKKPQSSGQPRGIIRRVFVWLLLSGWERWRAGKGGRRCPAGSLCCEELVGPRVLKLAGDVHKKNLL